MKLATFNIYWLGGESDVTRTPGDNQRLADVIAEVNADVYAFQEIVDPDVLREILDAADAQAGRQYTMHDAQNRLLGVGAGAPDNDQMVVVAYDAGRYDLLAASAIRGGVSRPPYAVRLRQKSNGREITVVGVHFKSGWPDILGVSHSEKREKQCRHLARWLAGDLDHDNPNFPAPADGEHVVILGDFNAVYDTSDADHPYFAGQPLFPRFVASLDPLREGRMAEWSWDKPVPRSAGDGQVSNYVDWLLIDFIMFSPSLAGRVTWPPTLYAFDKLGAYGKRFSDHRPVYAEVNV